MTHLAHNLLIDSSSQMGCGRVLIGYTLFVFLWQLQTGFLPFLAGGITCAESTQIETTNWLQCSTKCWALPQLVPRKVALRPSITQICGWSHFQYGLPQCTKWLTRMEGGGGREWSIRMLRHSGDQQQQCPIYTIYGRHSSENSHKKEVDKYQHIEPATPMAGLW